MDKCDPTGFVVLAEAGPHLSSQEVIELEKRYGANNYSPIPVVLERGAGAHVWDVEGNEYLDFLSGIGAVNQGHTHSKIIGALIEQADKLTHVSRAFYSDAFGPFAQMATEMFGYEKILVMNTGVEAVETAIKVARKWGYTKKGIPEGKAKILVADGSFHGRTLGAISASSTPNAAVFGPLVPQFERVPFSDIRALKQALKDPNFAAFIVEPIQGEGGVVVPDPGYRKAAHALCKEANVLFIADEVQTGIARTGRLLACDHEEIHPDIVILGKALSGGVIPVSAILADESVMGVIMPGDHGSTFGGNPLAMRVAQAALEVVRDEKLAERSEQLGRIFRHELALLPHPVVQVRGKGLFNAVVFVPDAGVKAGDICLCLKEAGVLAKNPRDNVIRFAPPLVISETDLRIGIERIKKCIQAYRPLRK